MDRFWDRVAPGKIFEKRAEKIAILAGAGAGGTDASKGLLKFVETFHIPIATTLRAKGIFPEDHPLSLGVFGYAGTRHASVAMLSDDLELLIVLGSGLNERDTMHWNSKLVSQRGLFQVNVVPEAISAVYGGGATVVGDVYAFIEKIMSEPNELLGHLEAGKAVRDEWIDAFASYLAYTTRTIAQVTLFPYIPHVSFMNLGKSCLEKQSHSWTAAHTGLLPVNIGRVMNLELTFPQRTLGPMGWAIPAGIGVKTSKT